MGEKEIKVSPLEKVTPKARLEDWLESARQTE